MAHSTTSTEQFEPNLYFISTAVDLPRLKNIANLFVERNGPDKFCQPAQLTVDCRHILTEIAAAFQFEQNFCVKSKLVFSRNWRAADAGQ